MGMGKTVPFILLLVSCLPCGVRAQGIVRKYYVIPLTNELNSAQMVVLYNEREVATLQTNFPEAQLIYIYSAVFEIFF